MGSGKRTQFLLGFLSAILSIALVVSPMTIQAFADEVTDEDTSEEVQETSEKDAEELGENVVEPNDPSSPEVFGPEFPGRQEHATGGIYDDSPAPSIHDANEQERPLYAGEIPTRYSSAEKGYVTPVRNQNPFGTCWAFATIGAIESSILSHGQAPSASALDLSERHLAYYAYHAQADPLGNTAGDATIPIATRDKDMRPDPYLTRGGNSSIASYTLGSWMGVVQESAIPTYQDLVTSYYNWTDWSGGGEGILNTEAFLGETSLNPSLSHSQNSWHITDVRRIAMADRDDVKQAIMEYGGLALAIYYEDGLENYETGAYYNYSSERTNHDVVLIGWDDNYPASHFVSEYYGGTQQPQSDGAWLVKNSWGPYNANDGYLWISYEDVSLNTESAKAIAYEVEPASVKTNIYQYDGSTGGFYNTVNSYGRIASVFVPEANPNGTETLTSISFSLYDVNVRYAIRLYMNLEDPTNPDSGTLVEIGDYSSTVNGYTTYAGYYTVDLPNPVRLTEGVPFAVVIVLSHDDGSDVKYAVDVTAGPDGFYGEVYDWVQFQSHVEPQQSFEMNVANTSWEDLSEANRYEDESQPVCARIKAFTTNSAAKGGDIAGAQSSIDGHDNLTMNYRPGSNEFRPRFYDGDYRLIERVDYEITFENNDAPGLATATVTGIGDYYGSRQFTYTIRRVSLFDSYWLTTSDQWMATSPLGSFVFTGEAIEPEFGFASAGMPSMDGYPYKGLLEPMEGKDYVVEYIDNVNVGTAQLIITGVGGFYGSGDYTFQIVPADIATTTIAAIPDQTVTGGEIRPKLSIKLGNYVLTEGVDYTTEYSDNVGAGTATVTISGINNFEGMTSVTFKIQELQVALIPIYRMYNTKTSEHLWTKSKAEYNACGTGNYKDWRQENIAWYSPNLPTPASYAKSTQGDCVYVYRLYDKGRTGDHIYLVYGAEMRQYLANGWVVDKGAGFWTLKKGATISGRKTIPIYRAYNPKLKRGKHHYTPSKVEYDTICKKHGWKPEGVKFYVIKK